MKQSSGIIYTLNTKGTQATEQQQTTWTLAGVFDYEGRRVRTVMKDGEPWFVAKDVCDVLEIAKPRNAVSRLSEDEARTVGVTDSLGRNQETYVVNEPGLYRLIFTSRKAEAEQFKRWVTHEVLPSIRKTGQYTAPQPTPMTQSELMLMQAQITVEHERRLALLEQKEAGWDAKIDGIQRMLTETPDRAKVNREMVHLARMFYGGIQNIGKARYAVACIIYDKYGYDVHSRVIHEKKRIQRERSEQGKEAYAPSTLDNKVNAMVIYERDGMLGEVMKVIAGLIAGRISA